MNPFVVVTLVSIKTLERLPFHRLVEAAHILTTVDLALLCGA